MSFSAKNAGWLFLILVTLAFSGWYFASSKAHYKLDDKTLNLTADNRITNLTLVQYDKSGHKVHQLKTPQMIHIPNENTNYFTEPRIIIIQDKQQPWEIQAKEGTSVKGGEKITLRSNVIIEQYLSSQGEKNHFETEMLDYYPQKKMAETDQSIHYEQPGAVVESLGMRAWLEDKRIQLLSRARGHYEPSHG